MVKKANSENTIPNAEVELLRAKVAELESKQQALEERNKFPQINHLEEMRQLRKRGQDDAGSIKYKDIHDHRNIRLYHTNGIHVGRALGPIHPANAEDTFQRFHDKGIILSIQRPTQEHIDRYKATAEYKALAKKEFSRREAKKSVTKENSIDKLTKAVADLAGIPIDQVNQIRPNAVVGAGR